MPEVNESSREHGLRHQLSAGQMAMVAVGSSIGTGLLLGSGAAVQIAGPGVIISYLIGAFLAWTVANALGELATAHPAAGSFGVYAELYLNRWASFVVRYAFWFAVAVAVGAELVAASTYSRYWFPSVPGVLWVAIYSAVLLLVNLGSVLNLGRFEYWFAMVKLVTIVAFVLIGAWLLVGGRVAPQYEVNGGFLPNGRFSPLLAVSFALFSFLGVEMVAISSGEARSAAEIPRATKITFALLAFVYVGATAVLVGIMPWNRAGVTQSPFVTVFEVAGIPAASSVLNFVVLTAALSGANANLYASSRLFFSLARAGYAPEAFGRLNHAGSPTWSLVISGFGVPLAFVMEQWAPQSAFLAIIGASLFGGMLGWCIALLAHIVFRRRLTPEQVAALPMHTIGGTWASVVGFWGIALVVASTWWVPQSRITITSGLPYLAILSVAYMVFRKRWRGKS